MGSDTGYILEMNHITKEFPGVKALKDVTFKVRRGGAWPYGRKWGG